MSDTKASENFEMLKECGIEWALQGEGSTIRDDIRDLECFLRANYTPNFNLLLQYRLDPSRYRPLVQTLASPMTTPIRAMVALLVEGGQIENVEFKYARNKSAELVVALISPTNKKIVFQSEELWDFEILRHLGFMKMNGKPIIDGYYATRTD